MWTYYHNPKCSKSRAGLNLLQENNIDFKLREYLKKPLSAEELKILCKKFHCSPEDIIRKKEKIYLDQKSLPKNAEEFIDILVEFPALMERPILEGSNHATVGRPPEKILDILKGK